VVTWAIDQKGYSQRRACALIGIAPKMSTPERNCFGGPE